MENWDYKYRLMVHVARALKDGDIKKDKLVDQVLKDWLPCLAPALRLCV